jgi:hypothetical protein
MTYRVLGNIETFEMDKYYKFFLIKTNC